MIRQAVIAAIAFLVLLACPGCEEWPKSSDSGGDEPKKSVLAVQAFINADADDRIMSICNSISGVEGYRSDLNPEGFIPHITIAACWASQDEMSKATPQFARRLIDLNAVNVSMTLQQIERDGRLSYFLVPEPTQELLQFHAQVHEKLEWSDRPYGRYLPDDWWPHLTLFSVPKSERYHISDALLQLRKIRMVRLERLALIGFGPMRTLHEVELHACSQTGD